MPNGSFSWLTMAQAVTQLGQRLNITPSSSSFWTINELQTILATSLRQYNSLVWYWKQDFTFSSNQLWNSLGSLPNSPRLRTITDQQVYAELEYLLMEPSNNTSTWTGTNQFNLSVISQALQRRRDEMIQVSNCNQGLLSQIPLTPNQTRTYLPDTVIDVERVRYLPALATPTGSSTANPNVINVSYTAGIAVGQSVYGTGINYWSTVTAIGPGTVTLSLPTTGPVSGQLVFSQPSTLYRDDTIAQEFYEAPLYQQNPGTPQTFSLSSEPPLSWQVDVPPAMPGTYEGIVLQSGAPFNPPTPTLIGIPNDFVWVLEFGALADLLGQEPESTDRERAAYCLKRYQDGLQLMLKSPWIELAKVNGQAVSVDSIVSMDRYDPEWDSNPTGFGPVIVAGGMDNIAAPIGAGIGVTVLGNAPIMDSNGNLQISQADADIMYYLAQCRAVLKQGGENFKEALELEKRAIQACAAENTRLRSMGAFSDILVQRSNVQERDANRYNTKQK